LLQRETPDLVTPDLWPPNIDLNPVDYRICGVLQERFIGNLLKTERWWTEVASDWSVVWHSAKCPWSADWPMTSLS